MRRRSRGTIVVALLPLLAACVPAPVGTPPVPSPAIVSSPTPFTPSPAEGVTPAPACTENGTWVDFHYRGVAIAGDVPARVYLPPCYEGDSGRYPVAYFLHGKPYTEEQWIDLGLPQLVEGAEATLPPMILVLARQPEPLFSNSDGGPGSYETEFLEGLVASIDRTFRTDPRADRRAVVGLSRGGVWALEIPLRNPGQFDVVAALSPALAVNYARDVYEPLQLAATADPVPGRFFLGAGEDDWARSKTEEMAGILAGRGISPELVIVPGDHSDPTWETLLPDVLAFLAGSFGAE
jgi:enterochelin esterase-like enzyme